MIVTGAHERGLALAADALRAGGAVVIPTDTVYGLAARADDKAGIDRLFDLKARPPERSIAVLVSSVAQAQTIATLGRDEQMAAERWWPGPLTLVVQRHVGAGDWLGRADGTVGVRQPDDRFASDLAALVGPLATTSANRSGEPTPADALGAARALSGVVEVIVDDGDRAGQASTVAKFGADGVPVILRDGPISVDQLRLR